MKNPSLLALAGLAISFAVPTFAQQQDTVDPKIVELIVAHQKIYDEAMNNNDAVAGTGCNRRDAIPDDHSEQQIAP
jgi:hypothetical protein